jgi:hypothetical protein
LEKNHIKKTAMKNKTQYRISIALFLIGLCLTCSHDLMSQSWEWAKQLSSKAMNAGNAIATDKSGNSYVTGSFSDTLRIDGTILVSQGFYDIFLAKINSRGELQWIRQAGGNDMDEAYGVAIGKNEEVYITGYISGDAQFSDQKVKGSTNRDFFLTKYDTSGKVLWVNLETGANEDYGTSVCVDQNGDVYATGIFHGTINTERSTLRSVGPRNTFIIKHDGSGKYLWAKTGTCTGSTEASEISVDNDGNVYVAGTFEGTAIFDKRRIISQHHKEVFLARYSTSGNLQWLKKGGSSSEESSLSSISFDPYGNIIITGTFSGTAYFDEDFLKSNGSKDIFVVKYNKQGTELWARQTGGKGNEISRSLVVDRDGNIYVAGEFNLSFIFGESQINSTGDWNVFVVKYNRGGEMIAGSQVGGIGYNKATGIAMDDKSNIYLLGYFSRKISLSDQELETQREQGAGFIAKYEGLLKQ